VYEYWTPANGTVSSLEQQTDGSSTCTLFQDVSAADPPMEVTYTTQSRVTGACFR